MQQQTTAACDCVHGAPLVARGGKWPPADAGAPSSRSRARPDTGGEVGKMPRDDDGWVGEASRDCSWAAAAVAGANLCLRAPRIGDRS